MLFGHQYHKEEAMKKITLKLIDNRKMWDEETKPFRVKEVINSIEWKIGDLIEINEVNSLIANRPDLDVILTSDIIK
jgi:hypothetical protein